MEMLEGMLEETLGGTLVESLVLEELLEETLSKSWALRGILEVSETLRGTTGVVLWMVQARRGMLDIS